MILCSIYKMLFLVACMSAAIFICRCVKGVWDSRLSKLFLDRRQRVLSQMELVGIHMGECFVDLLTLFGPITSLVLKLIRKRRMKRVDEQLPGALRLIAGALKAGLAMPQALEVAASEIPSPLGDELQMVSDRIKLGATVEEAMEVFGERLPTEDILLLVQSIDVLRRTGGNLVEILDLLSRTVDERRGIARKVKTVTTQGRFQGGMLLVMPWALAIILYLVAPDYIEPLINTRFGLFFVCIAVVFEFLGALWIKVIVDVEV